MTGKIKINEKVTIKAPAEKIFNFLVDPNKIPLVMPSLIANRKVPKLPLKVGSTFDYEYQMFGVKVKGSWTAKKIKPNTSYHAVTDGDVSSKWFYELKESGNKTTVELIIDYGLPSNVLKKIETKVVAKVNETEAKHYLQNLKTALEF